ncbi:MAG: hypothetical protein RBQ64_05685, partial [Candidatus Izemoplasmatales bacterium]|nr:hypothetical protein [Candidatus Izemoplasmatales bacterium]
TVDAERGTATGQKVFTIKVGELSVSTLAEVLAGSNNDLFKVQATIIGGGYNTYFIQDDTGALALYVASDLRTFFSENVGNVVEIVGTRSTYNGLNQISVQTATFVEAGTLWSSENVDAIELNSTNLLPYQSHLIELTAMEVVSTSTDSNGNITLVLKDLRDNTTVAARWDSRYSVPTELSTLLASLVQGDIINIQAILGWYNNPQLTISAQTVITMTTDAEKLAADAATIPATIETTSGATEMAPLVGPYGSTFVWDVTEITNAGGTFDPLTGEITYPDVLVDTVYNVTGTASLGTETPVNLSLAITVLAMTDAEKLAAAIADTGIDEDCDGYQVVMLPLTGLYGTTISWTVISGEATLDGDGTTLTYAQGVAVADVVLEATFVNGLESQTKQFTVTVTPVTIIDDFSAFFVMTDGINYDIADDVYVYITGTVTANSYDGLFLQDANGVGFFMYKPDSDSTMNVGDLVVYYGQVDTDNGARQLGFGADLMELVSTANATTPVVFTASDMVAIDITDAGKLVTFTGLEVKEYIGSQVIFTVNDGVTTRDISLRYYTNFADYLPIMFQPGDVLPEVTFNIYNFKDATAQIDMLVFAAGQPAFDALDLTVTNAIAYDYAPEYIYLFETSVKTDNNIHNVYLQSVLETANPGDMYAGIMNDMARYLGAIYRATSSNVIEIEYKDVVYTWDTLEPNLGSNWYNGATSLVSVIVADFMGGTLVDGVTLKLGDGTFNYYLELTFEVTMDLDQAVIDVLEDAVTYTYDPAYTYLANSVVYEDYAIYSEYYQSVLDAANPSDPMAGIMNDMARYLGAIYRVAGSDITTIVYDGVEYTWNVAGILLGSNWEDSVGTTLVSVIVADFGLGTLTDSVPLTFRNAAGHEVAVALEFAIVPEITTYTQDFAFLTTSTTSYSTSVQHTDTNNFAWDLLGRQNVGSWMLGNAADASYIQVTAQGGISSITFDVVRAFTNTNVRSGEVFVNGVSVGTFNVDVNSDTVQVITIENINVSGEVVIKIVTTSPGSRGAFNVDNIVWNDYSA